MHTLPAQVYVACAAEAAAEGRPTPPLSVGFTYELCAGLEDKAKSREQTVKEEVSGGVGWLAVRKISMMEQAGFLPSSAEQDASSAM